MCKLLNRQEFKSKVFERDNNKCVICGKDGVDAHHIIDRKCWPDGGYYVDNGVTLCSSCHLLAEKGIYSPEYLRSKAKITKLVLPPNLDSNKCYDKWGKELFPLKYIKINNKKHKGKLIISNNVTNIKLYSFKKFNRGIGDNVVGVCFKDELKNYFPDIDLSKIDMIKYEYFLSIDDNLIAHLL